MARNIENGNVFDFLKSIAKRSQSNTDIDSSDDSKNETAVIGAGLASMSNNETPTYKEWNPAEEGTTLKDIEGGTRFYSKGTYFMEEGQEEFSQFGSVGGLYTGIAGNDSDNLINGKGHHKENIASEWFPKWRTYDHDDQIAAGEGNDTVYGHDGHDKIWGEGGNDYLNGGGMNDSIWGGDGNDTIKGESGDDRLWGNGGHDYLDGGRGHDTIDGGAGDDEIKGGDGDDSLSGGGGIDVIHGDAGNDKIHGNDGDDRLFGGSGNDSISAQDGNDSLEGNDGNDTLWGGNGSDTIKGGEGDDSIMGGADDDVLFGGTGNDIFVFHNNSGQDIVEDYEVGDTVHFRYRNDSSEWDAVVQEDGLLIQFDNGDSILFRDIYDISDLNIIM
jgi:Ca2+-binding RTX toxin-like protein